MDQAKSHLKDMVDTRDKSSTIHEIAMLKNLSTEGNHGLAITLRHELGHWQTQSWLTVRMTSYLKQDVQGVDAR